MPTDILLDEDNDLFFDGRDFQLVKEFLEVVQSASIRFRFIQTEWVYDFTMGIPWLSEMFATDISYERKRQWLVETLQKTIGVNKIKEFKFTIDPVNRGALVEFIANTIYGTIEGSVTI